MQEPTADSTTLEDGEGAVKETASSLEERLMNIIAELEARIEKLEIDAAKLKSGMPQIAF